MCHSNVSLGIRRINAEIGGNLQKCGLSLRFARPRKLIARRLVNGIGDLKNVLPVG
jgi:hypothetical protein